MLAILLTAALAAAPQLTAQEAKTLPLHDLANRLLGASGSIMIDVDRPRFDSLEPVRFYSHAIAWGSYFGVCAADRVTVEFDEHDRIEALQTERRYGVEGDMYRAPGTWTYDEFGEMCSAVDSTRGYFPAPSHGAAQDIARYVDAIAGLGPFSQQTFDYSCEGLCSDQAKDLAWLRLSEIQSVREIDCDNVSLKLPDCYEITVGSGVGPFPKTFRVYGSNYMNKTVIQRISVHVGSTLAGLRPNNSFKPNLLRSTNNMAG
jgi:hypothetical protein